MKNDKIINTIWYFLAVIFLIPMIFHVILSTQNTKTIIIPKNPPIGALIHTSGSGEQFDPIKEHINLLENINSQIIKQNKQSKTTNLISAFGYFLTIIACILSSSETRRLKLLKLLSEIKIYINRVILYLKAQVKIKMKHKKRQ